MAWRDIRDKVRKRYFIPFAALCLACVYVPLKQTVDAVDEQGTTPEAIVEYLFDAGLRIRTNNLEQFLVQETTYDSLNMIDFSRDSLPGGLVYEDNGLQFYSVPSSEASIRSAENALVARYLAKAEQRPLEEAVQLLEQPFIAHRIAAYQEESGLMPFAIKKERFQARVLTGGSYPRLWKEFKGFFNAFEFEQPAVYASDDIFRFLETTETPGRLVGYWEGFTWTKPLDLELARGEAFSLNWPYLSIRPDGDVFLVRHFDNQELLHEYEVSPETVTQRPLP